MDTKSCAICGREFSKPREVSKANWANRNFCSRTCAGKARRDQPQTKTCQNCGTEFTRKRASNKDWEARRYCSTTCAYADRTGKNRGEKHWAWKGGRYDHAGYVALYIHPDHPLFSMAHQSGRVLEHRLVMAEHLGRPLETYETIHHINGNRSDNRLENLQLRSGRHGNGHTLRCRSCGSTDIEHSEI